MTLAALRLNPLLLALLAFLLLAGPGSTSHAAESAAEAAAVPAPSAGGTDAASGAPLPEQFGMSLEWGYVYDPGPDRTFTMVRAFKIYDYATAWRQKRAPNTLRFKVEGALGTTINPEPDFMASFNILAMKYPLGYRGSVRPYGEAGIGVIYTQFRVDGQGLHINFNPLLGAGLEFPQPDGRHFFGAIRASHLSNAQLNRDNRGVNAVILQVGRIF